MLHKMRLFFLVAQVILDRSVSLLVLVAGVSSMANPKRMKDVRFKMALGAESLGEHFGDPLGRNCDNDCLLCFWYHGGFYAVAECAVSRQCLKSCTLHILVKYAFRLCFELLATNPSRENDFIF